MVSQKEAEAKRLKQQQESSMDPHELRMLRETEAAAKSHDQQKTKHYAKLGATFAVSTNIMSPRKGRRNTHGE